MLVWLLSFPIEYDEDVAGVPEYLTYPPGSASCLAFEAPRDLVKSAIHFESGIFSAKV